MERGARPECIVSPVATRPPSRGMDRCGEFIQRAGRCHEGDVRGDSSGWGDGRLLGMAAGHGRRDVRGERRVESSCRHGGGARVRSEQPGRRGHAHRTVSRERFPAIGVARRGRVVTHAATALRVVGGYPAHECSVFSERSYRQSCHRSRSTPFPRCFPRISVRARWDAFEGSYRAIFASNDRWTFETRRFDAQLSPSGDAAWVTIENVLTLNGVRQTAWQVVVLKKIEGQWKMVLGFSAPLPAAGR